MISELDLRSVMSGYTGKLGVYDERSPKLYE